MPRRHDSPEPAVPEALLADVRGRALPLRTPADLDPLLDRISDKRVVLLGEASHGTHEYYAWRAEITKRLIADHGFAFVAVEGDWPDCYRVNRFVKGFPGAAPDAGEALGTFRRWPSWMWANEEVRDLAGWLRGCNDARPADARAGFYGLDVYSLWDSLREVMAYLRRNDPAALPEARRALRCFHPYGEDAHEYARATVLVPTSCEREVTQLLQKLLASAPADGEDGRDGRFAAEQNARVVRDAEAYYRAMVRSDRNSWNVRDRHMAETLDQLLKHHGPAAKAVVWEHNTHVGDARYTDMADDGTVNVGQLAREAYGRESVALVGFGSHRGSVIAGASWDAPWEEMDVPPGRAGSWEDVLHAAGPEDKLLFFDDPSDELLAWRGHRAIGVVYRPHLERYGNYVPTVLPERYDAFLYLDQTTAVRPLIPPALEEHDEELPETFPSGV